MHIELIALMFAGLLQVFQIIFMAVRANRELGRDVVLGPRDHEGDSKPMAERVDPQTGRMFRAVSNHFEGLILFTIAVVVVIMAGYSSPFTEICACIYVVARVLYIPAYYFGLSPWRSYIWVMGFLSTALMLMSTFLLSVL